MRDNISFGGSGPLSPPLDTPLRRQQSEAIQQTSAITLHVIL